MAISFIDKFFLNVLHKLYHLILHWIMSIFVDHLYKSNQTVTFYQLLNYPDTDITLDMQNKNSNFFRISIREKIILTEHFNTINR